ncbi:WD40 repeat domain-containing protein [Streptomyces sp. NPDC059373]
MTPDVTAWPPLEGVTAAHGPALLDWAADATPGRPRVCLVRGAGGSGKSQLLAWFLMGSASDPRTTVHAAVLSAGLFADAFAWELGRQLGYGPLSPARLLDRLVADQRPLLLLVPDLHRSGRGPADRPAGDPATLVQDLVVPLLELPQTRAVIEVGDSGLLDGWGDAGSVGTIDAGDKPYEAFAKPEPVAQLPRTADGRPLWDQAPQALREHALDRALSAPDSEHAVRALLTDPGFLLHGSAVSIAACLADERIPAPPGLRETWRTAAPQLSNTEHSAAERAALLHAAALGASPALARYLLPLAEGHVFTAVWARPDAAVTALAPLEQGELLAADPLGDITLLDAVTGRTTAPVPSPRTARPQGIAVRPDHSLSLLLLTDTGALLPAGADFTGVLGHIAAHHGQAALRNPDRTPTALGQCPRSGITVVGDEQGNVHVWNLGAPQAAPLSRALHPAPVTAVACLALPGDEGTLVMSAAMDGTVRLWETSADPLPVPVEQRRALVTAMTAAPTADGPVLAVAWNDATLHLWHVLTGRVRPIPLLLPCQALALSPDSRLTVGGPEGAYALGLDTARLWD